MVMQVFTWCPRTNPTGTIRLRTLSARFGDGYEQSAGDGINTKLQAWPLQFVGTETYIAPILAFLDARQGYERFSWAPPLSTPIVVKANEYSLVPMGAGLYTLSVTFNQVGVV